MTVGEGRFLLYSYITPALKAADYRFEVSQNLAAKKGTGAMGAADLPVEQLNTHVRVTAPRYQLAPDQVLSTYPPAGTEGSYGGRLPQIVIKRRTLPWERGLTVPDGHGGQTAVDEKTPWLALVLIAEGEAELRLNQDVAKCVTAGVTLDGELDVAKANCLVVRQSILEKVLPTRKDVPLLAHAREVDIHDTELMMGDDDGFLAVIISNRLPVPGTNADGEPIPVKYLACLINLEGQFHRLLPEAPPPHESTRFLDFVGELSVEPSVFDHVAAGGLVEHWADPSINPAGPFAGAGGPAVGGFAGGPLAEAAHPHTAGPAPLAAGAMEAQSVIKTSGPGLTAYASQKGFAAKESTNIYALMAKDFAQVNFTLAEPEYTFPVLLHWSFISTGNVTFESLMEGLDSGLLGTTPEKPYDETGREPLEVAETGHVGLAHRTRRGDAVRTWYRGPLLPHPSSGERLPIAHSSDQLRAVIPDGREDLSLAAAFEVGRLLALSRPAMVSALLRWRQTQFQAARGESIWDGIRDGLPFDDMVLGDDIRQQLESKLRHLIAGNPDDMIGPHLPLIGPGDPVDWGAEPLELLGKGFGLAVDLAGGLRGVQDLSVMSQTLRDVTPPLAGLGRVGGVVGAGVIKDHLQGVLDATAEQLMSNVLASEIAIDPALGPTVVRTLDRGTVVASGGIDGSILDLPGGILDVGRGPRADSPAEPARRRAPSRRATPRKEPDPPVPPDPLDEVLARGRGRRTRKDPS